MFVGTPLTQREFKAARCIAKALSVKETAAVMNVPSWEVKRLHRNLIKKTGVRTIAQLVYFMNCELFLAGLLVKTYS
jgi:DNA-binding CsgD family transcriptional regulator